MGHPALVKAMHLPAESMASASVLSSINEPAVALAEDLIATVPGGQPRRVWLGHSGSDANEAAVRAIEAATGRRRFISFVGSYHGGSVGSMAVSGSPPRTTRPPGRAWFCSQYPDPYRPVLGVDPAETVLEYLQYLFETICPPDEVAAGRQHGILVVCDEVKEGLARTGWVHGYQAEGLAPDIVTFGRGMGRRPSPVGDRGTGRDPRRPARLRLCRRQPGTRSPLARVERS